LFTSAPLQALIVKFKENTISYAGDPPKPKSLARGVLCLGVKGENQIKPPIDEKEKSHEKFKDTFVNHSSYDSFNWRNER
jgi:hypothetical protein